MPLVILQFCHVTIIMIEFMLVFMSMITSHLICVEIYLNSVYSLISGLFSAGNLLELYLVF